MIRVLSYIVFATCLCLISTSAYAGKKDLDGKKSAGVLLKLDGVFEKTMLTLYKLEGYNEDGTPKKAKEIWLKLYKGQNGFVFKKAEPGEYFIRTVQQQLKWQTCFHEKTYKITLKPATVNFIGEFKPEKNIAQLQYLALQNGDLSLKGSESVYYIDGIIPPEIKQATLPDVDYAKKFVEEYLPKIDANVEASVLEDFSFKNRKNIFKVNNC